jgi:ADP-ribose pyrophosphatase YjhB (NUDIX family)
MKYCSECGVAVEWRIPEGDSLPRHVCPACGVIHYQNPKLVVGSIPEWEDRILLCRRAIEPRRGLWTLPAGYLELGETVAQGAIRETLEEANARVDITQLFALLSIPHISQVYVLFRARLLDADFHPGAETSEVALFAEADIPWDRLAFATVRSTLEHYYADRRAGEYKFHMGTIEKAREARGER